MMRVVSIIAAAALVRVVLPILEVSAATKITLLYVPLNAYTASFVAKDQGLFDHRGLDVDLTLAQNASVIGAALVADSAQIGVPTATVLLQADEQGLDLVIVAGTITYPQRPDSFGILARSGSGIATAKDLVGKKVAVPSLGGIGDVISKKWVQSSGIDYHRVDWVELQMPQMNDAMRSGLIDAANLAVPFYGRIITNKVGYQIVDFNNLLPAGSIVGPYASTRAWAKEHADAVRAFRGALDDAATYVSDPTHQESVLASIAKWTKLPPQAAGTIKIPINLNTDVKPEGLAFWIEVSREQGLIKGNPDPAGLIAP